jgi:hypothetical protein
MDDEVKDLLRVRVVELEKNRVYISRTDPYGYWSMKYEKGVLPGFLQGSYTSFNYALNALRNYLEAKGTFIKEIRETA